MAWRRIGELAGEVVRRAWAHALEQAHEIERITAPNEKAGEQRMNALDPQLPGGERNPEGTRPDSRPEGGRPRMETRGLRPDPPSEGLEAIGSGRSVNEAAAGEEPATSSCLPTAGRGMSIASPRAYPSPAVLSPLLVVMHSRAPAWER